MASDQAAPHSPSSPWEAARAEVPGLILVRVIAGGGQLQFWIAIGRTEKNLESGAELYDGATVVLPRPTGDPVSLDDAVATADRAWHDQKQPCASTSPATGSSA